MTEILASSLPFAIGIALSPIPLIAIVVVLSTNPGRALGFLAGWIVGVVVVGLLVFALPGLDTLQEGPTTLSIWLRIVLGGLLIWLGIRKWRARPGPEDHRDVPKLLSRLETAGAAGMVAMGFGLSALNPKVIALTFGGAANIHAYASTQLHQATGLMGFSLVASVTLIVPIAGFAVASEKACALLPKTKEWLIRHNDAVSAAVLLLLGLLLAGNGVILALAQ